MVTEENNTDVMRPQALEPSLELYPNPATNKVNIKLDGFQSMDVQLMVFDHLGKLVLTQDIDRVDFHVEELDVSTAKFSGGVYKVVVKSGETLLSKPVIIVH
jgi:hypothetical protein